MQVGEKIKQLRLSKGYSLRVFAERVGINYSHIYKIEKGERRAHYDLLMKICNAFDVELSYFDEYTKEEKNLLNDLKLDDKEIIDKYNLTVDGKKVSEKEMKVFLNQIRLLRELEED